MKKRYIIILLVFIYANVHAQAPDWQWAKSAGENGEENGRSICTDANGNVTVIGYFYSPSITFGTTTLTNAGASAYTYDMFIVQYDISGNVLWAKSVGGVSDDFGFGICTDVDGNIIVTGYFNSSSVTFGTTTLTNANGNGNQGDMFIAKYDVSGNVLWAKSAGGTSRDGGSSVCTGEASSIFVTGHFYSPSITFGTTILTNIGGCDMFIAKYDASGNVLWARNAGGNSFGQRVCTDVSENILVIGSFESSSITFGTTTLINAGGGGPPRDIFIVKYDANGNVLWAKSSGGTDYDFGSGICTDASGNIFITGSSFGKQSITFGTTTLVNTGLVNLFIVKYDASGNVLWAKNPGSVTSTYTFGHDICTDADGNILVTGSFDGTITFGTTTLIVNSSCCSAVFVVKYDSLGNVLWAQSPEGTLRSHSIGYGICTDAIGNVSVTGFFELDSVTFGTTTLTNAGSSYTKDMYIAQLGSASGSGIGSFEDQNSIAVYPNPGSGKFNIQSTMYDVRYNSIEVYNILGEKVYQSEIKNLFPIAISTEIDISKQPDGIYFLNIKTNEDRMDVRITNKKIIISR